MLASLDKVQVDTLQVQQFSMRFFLLYRLDQDPIRLKRSHSLQSRDEKDLFKEK
jgi:hypothetical protein